MVLVKLLQFKFVENLGCNGIYMMVRHESS